MKDGPILMNAEMVRATLDGRKTQTRRIAKLNAAGRVEKGGRNWHVEDAAAVIACPYGAVGDTLWVRETWQSEGVHGHERDFPVRYRASDDDRVMGGRWRPSIFMPRWASRITLRITDVRIERLQDISNEDAAAEGWLGPDEANTIRNAYPIAWYSHLWESINGRGSWAENPFVWAISFEVVK